MTDTCSLTADELAVRRDAFLALIGDALLTARVTLRRDPRTEAALDAVVRAESECCPFLDVRVTRGKATLLVDVEYGRSGGSRRAIAGNRGLGPV
jgi:hypothetical protein